MSTASEIMSPKSITVVLLKGHIVKLTSKCLVYACRLCCFQPCHRIFFMQQININAETYNQTNAESKYSFLVLHRTSISFLLRIIEHHRKGGLKPLRDKGWGNSVCGHDTLESLIYIYQMWLSAHDSALQSSITAQGEAFEAPHFPGELLIVNGC